MKRWFVALAALLAGGGVSAVMLVAADPSRGAVDAYAAARDLPAGTAISGDALELRHVSLLGSDAQLFTPGDESRLMSMRASHDLVSGQLIQRSDVMGATTLADRRLVFIPIAAAPTTPAGGRVDLLIIGGAPDRPSVSTFALGVEVRATVSGGLIIVVPVKQAAAFVYAAATMHLAAVVAEPGAADGVELPIAGPDDAIAVAAER